MASKLKIKTLAGKFYLFLASVLAIAAIDTYILTVNSQSGNEYKEFSSYLHAAQIEVIKLESFIDIYLSAINIPAYHVTEVIEDIKEQSYVISRVVTSMNTGRYSEILSSHGAAMATYRDVEAHWGAVDMDLLLFYSSITKDDTYLIHNRIDINTSLLTDELNILAGKVDTLAINKIDERKSNTVFVLMVSFIIVGMSAFLFMQSYLSPLKELTRKAQAIGDGDLKVRFNEDIDLEASLVAKTFNRILNNIASSSANTIDIIKGSEVKYVSEVHMKSVNKLTSIAGRSVSEYEFYNTAIGEAIEATGAFAGALFMVNFENAELKVSKGFKGTFFGDAEKLPIEDRHSAGTLRREVSVYKDIEFYPGEKYKKILKGYKVKSLISAPIIRGDSVIGYLDLAFAKEDDHAEHVEFVKAVGQSVGVVVGYTELFLDAHGKRRFLERVFNQHPLGVAVFDSSGKCVMASNEMKKILGMPPEMEKVSKYNYKDDGNLSVAGFDHSIRKGFDGFVDETIIDYDPAKVKGLAFVGLPRRLKVRSAPVYDTSGNINNVMAVFIDAALESDSK